MRGGEVKRLGEGEGVVMRDWFWEVAGGHCVMYAYICMECLVVGSLHEDDRGTDVEQQGCKGRHVGKV